MITKLALNKITSYKNQTVLETDKKINLIYGLNGTGKSTLSDFLHQQTDDKYKNCSVEGLDDNHEILVYNQTFIQETFFELENLKGIFTLSKENKDAERRITNAQKEIAKFETDKEVKGKELETEKISIKEKQETAKNTIWKIKTDYNDVDRVLGFCLDGYKSSKDLLFNYITKLAKPVAKPTKSIGDLKNDLQYISGNNVQKYSALSQISFASQNIETEILFSKQIIGNENSTFSQLIKELRNSDWIKAGLEYLPTEFIEKNGTCPFCQEKTISNILVKNIEDYFDAFYETDINSLKKCLSDYSQVIQSIPNISVFEANIKFDTFKKDFEIKYNTFIKVIENNKKLIEDKIKTPSISVILIDSTTALQELNEVIQKINISITEHNKNIDESETIKSNIKTIFWEIMRWDYDQTISSFNTDKATSENKIDTLDISIENLSKKFQSRTQSLLNNKNRL